MSSSTIRKPALTLQQAVERSPMLARLGALAAESSARLDLIRPLLPPALRNAVRAGAMDGQTWCVLVPHNAAAAKLRQLMPTLLDALREHGHALDTIRIKVDRSGA